MQPKVVVLDYGAGNVRSAVHALSRLGASVELSADFTTAVQADGLVVPGVGAFGAVMEKLSAIRAAQIIDKRLAGGRAVLGICVGMQVLFEAGDEHGVHTTGLGQWPGTVHKLQAEVTPHMGWSPVQVPEGSKLFAGVQQERFYFVHSYAAQEFTLGQNPAPESPFAPPLVTWANHGGDFVAAVENGALSATQFHPEKSGDAGAQLLENWLGTL